MSKGSDPQSPWPGRRGKSRAKRASTLAQQVPPAPNLAWAKWIDALGADEPALSDSPEFAEQRLRAATEAAERARLQREAASATAEDAAPRAEKNRPARPVRVPKRHAPETRPDDLPLAASTVAIPALPPPALPPPALLAPAPIPRAPMASPPTTSAPIAPQSAGALGDPLRDEPLPDRYHQDRIVLIARDPYWLYAYWEVTPSNWAHARSLLGETATQLTLRVYDYPPAAREASGWMDIEVTAEAKNWYLHGGQPGHGFEVEIGLRSADGRFVPLARSNRVTTPRDRMSDVLDEQWLSNPADYERMYALSGGLETMGSASAELPELVTRRMAEMLGSGAVSSFGHAGPSAERAGRAFWFGLRAELIVYGATAPDAIVTCQGRPVPLRPDGTFTLRFALPDGAQEIPCQAIAADHLESITITKAVTKSTTRSERSHRPS